MNRAKQIFPLRDSKPELIVQKLLTHLGIVFQKHAIVPEIGLHQWDLLIPSSETLIEVDGCYWHGCPCRMRPLSPEQIKTKARDAKLTFLARSLGWKVIRIPEHDIVSNNLQGIFESVG
ncbi:MAG: hypothetical protein IH991_06215 [Planctomycetes bacterium]|nr:hypothetical protein [Planctomycetota bacterium]